jgi:beta-phosphoglucomutase-like phosphatase (HAD superfamily)
MVIEDAVSGVISGKAAGCFVVGITTSFAVEDLASAGADLVLSSFRNLGNRLFDDRRSLGALCYPKVSAACKEN